MKVKELIEFLQKYNPELELTLSITETKKGFDIVSPFGIEHRIVGMEIIRGDYKKEKRRKR